MNTNCSQVQRGDERDGKQKRRISHLPQVRASKRCSFSFYLRILVTWISFIGAFGVFSSTLFTCIILIYHPQTSQEEVYDT